MSVTRLIARDELRLMVRNRVAVIAVLLLVLLTLVAVTSAWSHQRGIAALRARHADAADAAFRGQPDRHPHRMVHYGTFIFRPLGPLAAFDPGVDAFTGNSMFLEGHRQNSANFGDVRQSALLVRFGQLTPAFVVQVVAPLVLIFLGYGALARETEQGTMRLLMMQGVGRGRIVRGKLLALGAAASLAALPAMIGLIAIAGRPGAPILPVLAIAIGHVGYLAVWTVLILLVSARVRRRRDALLMLIGLWAVAVVLLPRIAPDAARAAIPLADRLQTEVAVARDLRAMGDSHDPDDPHFAQFRRSVLARHGVARIEDLPVNYKGLLAIEGERLTALLYRRHGDAGHAAQARQTVLVDLAGLLSPAIALRSLSMAAAGTDLAGHRRFLEQAEAYRYALVQRLNRMQMADVRYADDIAADAGADRRKRIAARHWQTVPDFRFVPPTARDRAIAALPGLAVLAGWLAAALALLAIASRRLGTR